MRSGCWSAPTVSSDRPVVGVRYNFGSFSDDLTDLNTDNQGILLNLIAKF